MRRPQFDPLPCPKRGFIGMPVDRNSIANPDGVAVCSARRRHCDRRRRQRLRHNVAESGIRRYDAIAPLGAERAGLYGDIRCSALQRQLACVLSKPNGPTKTYHLATWTLPDLGEEAR